MASLPISTEIDAETMAIVDRVAHRRGISSAQFAAEAIQRVAESEEDFHAFVQEGVDSADRGPMISQEEMEAWIEERIAARRRV